MRKKKNEFFSRCDWINLTDHQRNKDTDKYLKTFNFETHFHRIDAIKFLKNFCGSVLLKKFQLHEIGRDIRLCSPQF
jgi:hypothetical protein